MNYDALLVAKDHTSYSLARFNELKIKRQIMEFCDEVDLSYDDDLTFEMLGCYVADLDRQIIENKVFNGYSLPQLVLTGWKLGLSVSELCIKLSESGNTLDDICDIETDSLFLVPDENLYKIPFNYTINKGKHTSGKGTDRIKKYCYRTSNVREPMTGVFESINTVSCITLDGFIKWYLNSNHGKYTQSTITLIYDTLRYSGCPKDLTDSQLEYILSNDFTFEEIPMFYFEALRVVSRKRVLGKDYGFLSLNDILYMCDLSYKDVRQAYRVFFKEGYVCKRYITALNDNERPEMFSSYLRTATTFNKEYVFDSSGNLLKNISEYTLTHGTRKESLTSRYRDMGFTSCYLFNN